MHRGKVIAVKFQHDNRIENNWEISINVYEIIPKGTWQGISVFWYIEK